LSPQIIGLRESSIFDDETEKTLDVHEPEINVLMAFSLLMVPHDHLWVISDRVSMDMSLGAKINVLKIEEKILVEGKRIWEQTELEEYGTPPSPVYVKAFGEVFVHVEMCASIDMGLASHEANGGLKKALPCVEPPAYMNPVGGLVDLTGYDAGHMRVALEFMHCTGQSVRGYDLYVGIADKGYCTRVINRSQPPIDACPVPSIGLPNDLDWKQRRFRLTNRMMRMIHHDEFLDNVAPFQGCDELFYVMGGLVVYGDNEEIPCTAPRIFNTICLHLLFR
jgi:hypothetical protein